MLTQGHYKAGWREYAWRESITELAGQERTYTGPRWDGIVRAGMTLLVTAEQGLGDMIQFVRLVEPLSRKGVTVLVSAARPLVSLLATAPGVARVFGPGDALPAYDAHAPLLALAPALEIDDTTIPAAVPYLKPDPQRRAEAADMLSAHAGRRRSGSPGGKQRARQRPAPFHPARNIEAVARRARHRLVLAATARG